MKTPPNLPSRLSLPLRIGTRESPLAMTQARLVSDSLETIYPALKNNIQLCPMKTSGDYILDEPLYLSGGKSLFVKELESSLLSNYIDLAVHSLKDMPSHQPEGLRIAAILKRTEARDALVSMKYETLHDLPFKARLGTSSLRRKAQALKLRPDLEVVPLRGNVNTRLEKIKNNEMDAAILSFAGLERLHLQEMAKEIFNPSCFIPAPGQGAICIEVCNDNPFLQLLLDPLNDQETALCTSAERSLLAAVEGSCRVPIGAWAHITASCTLLLQGFLADSLISSFNPSHTVLLSQEGPLQDAEKMGKNLGALLKEALLHQKIFKNI